MVISIIINLKEKCEKSKKKEYFFGALVSRAIKDVYLGLGYLEPAEKDRKGGPGKGHEEIILCLEGKIQLNFKDEEIILNEDEAFHLPEGVMMRLKNLEEKRSYFIIAGGHRGPMQIRNRIVLALDDLDGDSAVAVARRLSRGLDAVKVGYPLVLSEGLGVVSRLAEEAPVICDFKVADIPAVSAMIVERAVGAGASGVIVHGFVGHDTVQEAARAAGGRDVFVVAEMSHPGAVDYIQDRAEDMAAMAREAGATGIIAPATRPQRVTALRNVVGPDLLILSPGVGTQGGSAGDTVRAGADAVIVGRSLYRAEDPEAVLDELLADLAIG